MLDNKSHVFGNLAFCFEVGRSYLLGNDFIQKLGLYFSVFFHNLKGKFHQLSNHGYFLDDRLSLVDEADQMFVFGESSCFLSKESSRTDAIGQKVIDDTVVEKIIVLLNLRFRDRVYFFDNSFNRKYFFLHFVHHSTKSFLLFFDCVNSFLKLIDFAVLRFKFMLHFFKFFLEHLHVFLHLTLLLMLNFFRTSNSRIFLLLVAFDSNKLIKVIQFS